MKPTIVTNQSTKVNNLAPNTVFSRFLSPRDTRYLNTYRQAHGYPTWDINSANE